MSEKGMSRSDGEILREIFTFVIKAKEKPACGTSRVSKPDVVPRKRTSEPG
jgi:hypothetical protein